MTDSVLEVLAGEATATRTSFDRASTILATVQREHTSSPTADTAARLDNARSAHARAELASKQASEALEARRTTIARQAQERATFEASEAERATRTAAERESEAARARKNIELDVALASFESFPSDAADEIAEVVASVLAFERAWAKLSTRATAQLTAADSARALCRELGRDPDQVRVLYSSQVLALMVRKQVCERGVAEGIQVISGDSFGHVTPGLGAVGRGRG